ncbi:hypothetical protein BH93_10350 [Rhodococcoides fascians A25f]|uniref:hypothetical protein n=1 Tax=Rhodococcoides fascians TaxID=1828 RepID=UPI0012D32275|nr:hypothetical protein [Rhodococcus fascians]QII05719.1 hypothetical protein BH93_10350 [Rhodococcus fascians A25f]
MPPSGTAVRKATPYGAGYAITTRQAVANLGGHPLCAAFVHQDARLGAGGFAKARETLTTSALAQRGVPLRAP